MPQNQAIYDARQLGRTKMFILGVQHMFAMFGATVLVPALTGLSVSATLLFAGLGTLLFHFLTKRKVPAFLGSSFAFIGGYQAIAPMLEDGTANTQMLPYACFGVALAGLMYVILSALFKVFGTKKVMRYFPPIVTGPVIICIGLTLSSTAITNCRDNWAIALIAIAIVVGCNIWGKGMVKIIPILLGVVGSYGVAVICQVTGMHTMDPAKLQALADAPWIGLPFQFQDTLFGLFSRPDLNTGLLLTAAVTIMPLSLATMVEHIGDMCAISSTCERNYLQDPGFHRTLLGDGLATTLASIFGAPANTTYGENTGVLALSKVYDPRVIHAHRYHGRRVHGALRHDLRRRRAQRGGKPGGLHQQPQRHHCRPHHGAGHRHQLLRRGELPGGRGHYQPVRSGCGRHHRHRAQCHSPRQGLRVRPRREW
mgnify:CR=1 FL=1